MPLPYVLFLFCSIFALGFNKIDRRFTGVLFFLLVIFNILIVGLRSEYVGADSIQYYFSFKELNQMTLPRALGERYAAGYVFFARFIGFFSNSPYFFFFVVAVLTLTICFYFLKKYSQNPFLSIIIFFCLVWTDVVVLMRQSCALAIILLGVPILFSKRPYFFFAIVAIAMFFHTSAICAAILFILPKIKFNKKNVIRFLIVSVALASSSSLIWRLINVVGFSSFYDYKGGNYDITGTSFVNDFIVKVFPSIVCLLMGLKSKNEIITKEENFFYMVCLANISVGIIGLSSLILARMNMYLSFAAPIVATYLVGAKRYEPKTKRFFSLGIVIFMIAFFTTIQIARPGWMKITPYSPYWAPVNAYSVRATHYFW